MHQPLLATPCLLFAVLASAAAPATGPATRPAPLGPGDHRREIKSGDLGRSFLVHVPPKYDALKPCPVVLAFHGAMMNGKWMADYSGLSDKADQAGFIVVYPNGTAPGQPQAEAMLTWNAWELPVKPARAPADDVAFVSAMIDDLAEVLNIDRKRIFATGISNGGMMCYRLAAELSDRIAAIAPVAGTLAITKCDPKRPVPVLHFHGTQDRLVPFEGPNARTPRFLKFKSVDDTIKLFAKIDGCPEEPQSADLPDAAPDDNTTVKKITYGPGKDGCEVVLIRIENGGHTWPGAKRTILFLGNTTRDISANDMMWDFFQKHPMK